MSEDAAVHVGVITHCSVNSERHSDTLISSRDYSTGNVHLVWDAFLLLFFSFFQTVAVQPDSILLEGRFVSCMITCFVEGFLSTPPFQRDLEC